MGAQVRVLRRRIKTVQSTKKITKAMELIAASRIVKAQQRVRAAMPYAQEITRALSALASNASLDHPLLQPRPEIRRAGVVVVTSDRGLAGAYNSNVIKRAEELISALKANGTTPVLFVVGRKGANYYRFREREITTAWSGFSEQPTYDNARAISETLVPAFLAGADDTPDGPGLDGIHGVDEVHVVYTEFKSMLTQEPAVRRFAPLEVTEAEETIDALPAYEFEPEAEALLASMIPNYITARIFSALLESAASESAARRRAMKAATDNAQDLIRNLTREANQARQADITQEISEIVGGADALAATGSDE